MRLNFVVRHPWRTLALVCACMAVAGQRAEAQTSTGSIRGFITRVDGTPLSGASVVARNTELGAQRATTTSGNGFYALASLTPGPYEITVRRLGSAPQTRQVRVGIGEVMRLNFHLADTAAVLSTVVVTGTPATETRTSEVGTNISRAQIQDLPQNNRNFLDFALLAPGVQQRKAGISAGGASVNDANLFVDGASYKNDVLPGGIAGQDPSLGRTIRGVGLVLGNPFPQNAVQEFRVITQNYKAEYQKASGAIITAATRSGTNELHGSLFYTGQNQDFLARPYWDVHDSIQQPRYFKSQFGGSLGGPIIRDKAHFFLSYEGNYQNLQNRVVFRPATNLPPLPDSLLQGQGIYPAPLRSNLFFGKVDYALNGRQSLLFTANVRHDYDLRDFGGSTVVQSENRVNNDVNTFMLRHTLAAGAALTNDAQVSFQRTRWQVAPENLTAPHLDYGSWGVVRGGATSPQDFVQDRISLRNDLTWTRSSHVVKGGVDVDFLHYDIMKQLDQNPTFRFSPDQPGGFTSPYQATMQVGTPDLTTTNQEIGAYIQDDWTLARKLTLNVGVRWDFETDQLNNSYVTPQNVRDSVNAFLAQYPFFDPADYFTDGTQRPRFYGAFQPRLGFSYDVKGDGGTVIFGGGGLYYDRDNYNAVLDEKYKFQRPQYLFNFTPDGSNGTIKWDPSYLSRDGLLQLINSGKYNAPEVWMLNNTTRPPKSVQASAGVRQRIGAYQFSVTGTLVNTYNGLRWLFGNRDPNNNDNTVFGQHGIGAILLSSDDARTWYRGLLFEVAKPLTTEAHWGGNLSYTLAKTETNTYVEEDEFALDYKSPSEFARIPGQFDERHHVVANVIGRLPYGFLASTIITLGSGVPYTLSTNCDNPQDHVSDAFCAKQPVGNGNFHDWDENPAGQGPRSARPPGKWFGPFGKWAYRNVDFRLQKGFTMANQTVDITFDVYNLFNFTNFDYTGFQYNLRYDGTQTPPRAQIPFSTFDARRVQVGMRYSF